MILLDFKGGNMKKLLAIFLIVANANIFAQVFSEQQLLPASHELYDYLYLLENECGMTSLATDAPLTVAELKLAFDRIPYDELSDTGKKTYDTAMAVFEKKYLALKFDKVKTGASLTNTTTLFARTNKNVDFSFNTDYTGRMHYDPNDASKVDGYDSYIVRTVAPYYGFESPFLIMPLFFDFADTCAIYMEPFFRKSLSQIVEDKTPFLQCTNIPTDFVTFGLLELRDAYGSIGKSFSSWGFNIHIARSGLQFGRTLTGSVIYNSSFLTDAYIQFNVYSQHLKYNLNVIQRDRQTFIYLHDLEISPWKWLKLSILEGTLITGPFEFRYLNPLIVMHQFAGWDDYAPSVGTKKYIYKETNYCAYLGLALDIVPTKNLRIYVLYAQNEMQTFVELKNEFGKFYPDSFGLQFGFEYTLPVKHNAYWLFKAEGLYTTPFLYFKQQKAYSLMSNNGNAYSWIGTPFGPDCGAGVLSVKYLSVGKWDVEAQFAFIAHGENSFSLFSKRTKHKHKHIDEYYESFYPYAKQKLDGKSAENEKLARSHSLSGTLQYTNRLTFKGNYTLNDHFSFNAKADFNFIINNKNKKDNFAFGAEFSTFVRYKIF